MTGDTKRYFYRMPHDRKNPWNFGRNFSKNLHHAAGVAIEAVIATGQQVFAEIRTDEKGVTWTDYYTLHPEGIP